MQKEYKTFLEKRREAGDNMAYILLSVVGVVAVITALLFKAETKPPASK